MLQLAALASLAACASAGFLVPQTSYDLHARKRLAPKLRKRQDGGPSAAVVPAAKAQDMAYSSWTSCPNMLANGYTADSMYTGHPTAVNDYLECHYSLTNNRASAITCYYSADDGAKSPLSSPQCLGPSRMYTSKTAGSCYTQCAAQDKDGDALDTTAGNSYSKQSANDSFLQCAYALGGGGYRTCTYSARDGTPLRASSVVDTGENPDQANAQNENKAGCPDVALLKSPGAYCLTSLAPAS